MEGTKSCVRTPAEEDPPSMLSFAQRTKSAGLRIAPKSSQRADFDAHKLQPAQPKRVQVPANRCA